MGIYITLEILPEAIEPAAWASVYDETLTFLKSCPQGILGLRSRKVGTVRRFLYSRDLEHAVDRPEGRHWIVSGDAESKTFAETFHLYRDIGHYRSTGFSKPEVDVHEGDILAPGPDGSEVRSRTVFSDKTQGEGYHIPMLATAMLIEAAFPQAALAGGDIDARQARQAQALVEKVLGRTIPLPVRVDGPRLLDRLRVGRTDEQAMDVFRGRFLGTADEADGQLLAAFGVPAFARWFGRTLKADQRGEHGAATLGTIWRFTTWFNLGLPPDRLVEVVCVDEAGPRFDPVETAKAIAATWVAVPMDESASARAALGADGGTAESVDDQFAEAFLDMAGAAGRRNRVHIPQDTLLAAFSTRFPDQGEAIRTALESKTTKARSDLGDIAAALAKLGLDVSAKPSRSIETLVTVRSLDELEEQELEVLTTLGKGLKSHRPSFQKEMQPLLDSVSWQNVQAFASALAEQRGIVLTEDTWNRLDDKQNRGELEVALMLMSMRQDAKLFWDLRHVILENPVLCQYVAKVMTEPEPPSA